jgi:hypothetical protein
MREVVDRGNHVSVNGDMQVRGVKNANGSHWMFLSVRGEKTELKKESEG